jgi:hypothetical protein
MRSSTKQFDAFPTDRDETVHSARDRFLSTYGLDTAGYVDPRFPIHLGPIVLKTRNPGLLPYHDLHHVATGFPSGVIGEAEISAFELRASCGSPLIFILCVGAIACGLLLAPRRVIAAWRLSKEARGLYHTKVDYEELLSMRVSELRSLMNIPPDGYK